MSGSLEHKDNETFSVAIKSILTFPYQAKTREQTRPPSNYANLIGFLLRGSIQYQ